MRIVIDGLPIRGENSLSIVSEHVLSGWQQLGRDNELHLVIRRGASIAIPGSVTVHKVKFGRLPLLSRLWAQNVVLRRLCRSLQADVLLAVLPNTAVTPLPCPRVVMAWDFRYRVRPEQFSRKTLAMRRVSYAIGFRQADGVACISGRTRRDLLRFHPRLGRVPVRVAHLGADHADHWPITTGGAPYAIAFGHFDNKNVDLVLQAWAELVRTETGSVLPLRVVGVSKGNREALQSQVAALGLAEVVSISPWLPEPGFQEQFASSSLVVFPSDFEGFGLPAVEALRLGIPVVITPDPALLEVTGGHATVVDGKGPAALARAVERARHTTPLERAAGRDYAAPFTWATCASSLRVLLGEVTAPAPAPIPVARQRRRLGAIPARLGAAVAAGLLVIGGATAVSFALGTSESHPPPTGSGTTTVPDATRSASHTTTTTVGTSPGTGSDTRGTAGATSGQGAGGHPATSANATAGAGSGSGSGSDSGTGSTSTSTTLPPVTVPQMPTPSVPSTPTVTVPPVTVPTSVCSTATTVTTPTTIPCTAGVSGEACQCP